LKIGGGEDGMRRAGGGPDLTEWPQILVDDGLQGLLVPNGRDTPDGESGMRPHKIRVGLADLFSDDPA